LTSPPSLSALYSGAEAWTHVEDSGKSNQEWLLILLELPNGIPSHDTFGRFFSLLVPEAFQDAFLQWVQSVNDVFEVQDISILMANVLGSRTIEVMINQLFNPCPKITSRSCLPCCPSSAFQQELHHAAMRPLLRLEEKQHCSAISVSYLWTTP
jgi:hypothetical protein